jgi:hypothetical protein
MDRPEKFRFTLANLMLMMLPLAVAFWFARRASGNGSWIVWVIMLVIASAPAVGALAGGWRGMVKGAGSIGFVADRAFLYTILAAWFVLMIQMLAGQTSEAVRLWIFVVAIAVACAGPAVAVYVGGWNRAKESFERWCAVLLAVDVLLVIVFIGKLWIAGR